MAEKTNAMRVLEGKKVAYEAFFYSPDIHSATGVAEVLGFRPEVVYKTLVVLRERGRPLLVMVPGNDEINLKRLARSVGEKALRMASQKVAERLTGLQVGGISALALLNRGFDICIDRRALDLDFVVVSAGKRGVNLKVGVRDLVAVTQARPVDTTVEG